MLEIAMRRQGARLIPVDELAADNLVRVPADRDILVKITAPQNMKLLRFLWALASKVADACDHLHDREDAMDELKIRTRHVKYITNPVTGEVRIVPKSLTKLDGAGLSRLADRMVFVICRDIVPGLSETALKAEIMTMIGGPENSPSSSGSCPPAPENEPASQVSPDQDAGTLSSEPDTEQQEWKSTLPEGWPITYAAALRRAQKKESLEKLAREYWKQYGGWGKHEKTPDGEQAAAIFRAFNNNFGDKDAIDADLRELI